MKLNLLYLASYFPPSNFVASVRSGNIAKYLIRYNYCVKVVTVNPSILTAKQSQDNRLTFHNESLEMIHTDHGYRFLTPSFVHSKFADRVPLAAGFIRWMLRRLGVDPGIGWRFPILRVCSGMKSASIDLILATGPPFVSFDVAAKMADEWGVPFIIDYRDLWTNGPRSRFFERVRARQHERKIIDKAAAILVVSPSMATALDQEFGCGKKTHVLTNGYDPEELESISAHHFDTFSIVYTGTFYPPASVLDPLFEAFALLKNRGSTICEKIKFHYYGRQNSYCIETSSRFGVEDMVVAHGLVDRVEALSAVKGANLALVITNVTSSSSLADRGVITGKIFEPLGSGTPILLITPQGSDVRPMLNEAGCGQSFEGKQSLQIADFIENLYWGNVKLSVGNRYKYSWPHLIGRLDSIISQCIAS